ncbi:MAG: (2Fe-2S) ferredoxin domain-containing protein [Candidatus Auribacter fodinae]|jgi:NADH:ubiquinone oxidoreductase subunit E|uniref:(2Fe-2S) ferredoxin domain-containing protein n=1 Tax=Candidatus Auribacter fodinae TaxID=2093366 RepID=A0A3A4QWU9_9BACT|nr:MAG: (2Fe-2S) ferredoxin domain-containing protein [Candidatus Auribacter fodinae]
MDEKIEISICMGSSCFSRGNKNNLEVIQNYISEHGLADKVIVKGLLCEGLCAKGPNISINGTMHNEVDPVAVASLLNHYLKR